LVPFSQSSQLLVVVVVAVGPLLPFPIHLHFAPYLNKSK
jgi:hypothetical protein